MVRREMRDERGEIERKGLELGFLVQCWGDGVP